MTKLTGFTEFETTLGKSPAGVVVRQPDELSPANVPYTDELVANLEPGGSDPLKADPLGMGDDPTEASGLTYNEPKKQKGVLTGPNGRPFQKGNKAARGRKPKLVMLGINLAKVNINDHKLAVYLRRAEYYLKRRSRELCAMFGYASAGVNGILSSAAVQLANAKYISLVAAEMAGDPDTRKEYFELIKLSINLQNSARSNELAAYELCAKEAGATKMIKKQHASWIHDGGDV